MESHIKDATFNLVEPPAHWEKAAARRREKARVNIEEMILMTNKGIQECEESIARGEEPHVVTTVEAFMEWLEETEERNK